MNAELQELISEVKDLSNLARSIAQHNVQDRMDQKKESDQIIKLLEEITDVVTKSDSGIKRGL